jgi:hypothetical protein
MIEPVTSYTELMSAIQARVGALGLKLTDFDDLAGFPAGLSGKVFGMLQVKRLGPEKVFDAIRAAGLRLRVEVDPEQTAKMAIRISENYNPRQANQARNGHSASPAGPAVLSRIFKPLAKMGGKARMAQMTKDEMRAHQRAAAMAGVLKRRKEARKRLRAAHRRRQRDRAAKVAAPMTVQQYGEKLAREMAE